MKILAELIHAKSAASSAEYALILAIVGTGIILASQLLGSAVAGSISETSECIRTAGGSC